MRLAGLLDARRQLPHNLVADLRRDRYHGNVWIAGEKRPDQTRGTIHGPGYAGTGVTESYDVGDDVAADFHVFAIEWSKDSIQLFVDNKPFKRIFTPAALPPGGTWVFNAPFFLVLNLAVGGYPAPVGYPDRTPRGFRADMLVDYVRVYQK